MAITLTEKFGLKDGRRNFRLDPESDKAYYFGDGDEKEFIKTTLTRAERLAMPPRFVLWGSYGIGKTHKCRWIQHSIQQAGQEFLPVFAKLTNIDSKTTVSRGQDCLLKALDEDVVRRWAQEYMIDIKVNGTEPTFKELCPLSADVARAFTHLASDDEGYSRIAWRFLRGLKLEKEQQIRLGVDAAVLEDTEDFVAVFKVLGHLVKKRSQKTLLFLVDESENIARISDANQDTEWREWLRGILDLQDIGMVVTVGAEKQAQLPMVLVSADIIRRFGGADRYRQLSPMKTENITLFLCELLLNLIGDEHRQKLAAKAEVAGHPEGFVAEHYPFTEKGFKDFVALTARDPRQSKPSVVLHYLDQIAADVPDHEDLITSAAVEQFERQLKG